MTRRAAALYVVRRVAAAAALLVVISFATFALLDLAPGSEVDTLLAGRPHTVAAVQALDREYHLSGSLPARYVSWLGAAVGLNFGNSLYYAEPVKDIIGQSAPVTLELALVAFVLVMLVGVPLGVVSAVRRLSVWDRAIVGGTVVGVSMPPFVSGLLLIYVFGVLLGWLPAFGPGGSGPLDRMTHLVLPAVALATTALAIVVKVTRSAMARELDQDYIVFARTRGVSQWRVIVRHGLRNALIPIVTAGGLILGYMVAGAVLVEQVFSLPGLGSVLVNAAQARDVPTLQGVALVFAVVIISLNLIVDLLYFALDPRVRLGT